jgi:phosphatidylglycerophosphate synthase
VNLPNALTIGRIVATPFVAALPFVATSSMRGAGFVLFLIAAITDHYDGAIARRRGLITDLGRLLDPLADKLLLIGTFVPMFLLQHPVGDALAAVLPWAHTQASLFPFESVLGTVFLPWWVLAIVLGREAFMTVFRQIANKRGTVIAAIGPAKWKAGFQFTWIGAAYCWIFLRTLVDERGWHDAFAWTVTAQVLSLIGTVTMYVAVILTVYSLGLYLSRYGSVLLRSPRRS